MGVEGEASSLIFTYGTLKKGFANHALMQELIRCGDASFVGPSLTAEPYPLVCGPYRVPFLLNLPGSGVPVQGEVYAVSPRALHRLDDLEGTARGHYVRLPIQLLQVDGPAQAYYAHPSYAAELWKRIGEKGHATYSDKEATGRQLDDDVSQMPWTFQSTALVVGVTDIVGNSLTEILSL